MQDFVSAQVYAARSAGNARFSFSWQPTNRAGLPSTEFAAQTNALLDRLAAALAGSAESPEGACGVDWCNRDLAGASFTTAWRTFATWAGAAPPDTTPPQTTLTNGPSGSGSATTAAFAFAANEEGASFECSLDGAPFAACSPGVAYAELAIGAHHFEVRAVDASGNDDPTPATRDWTVVAPAERPHP